MILGTNLAKCGPTCYKFNKPFSKLIAFVGTNYLFYPKLINDFVIKCDPIKQNESELANINLKPKKAENFFVFYYYCNHSK